MDKKIIRMDVGREKISRIRKEISRIRKETKTSR